MAVGLGFLNGRQVERKEITTHHHSESAKESAKRACADRDASALFDCVVDHVARSDDTARNEQDLAAQQDMALWALGMVLVSGITMLIAGAALWYVRATLAETRAMTVEAQKTTAAAEKALSVTQKASTAELRPWVVIEARIIRISSTDTVVTVEYEVVFKNVGATIALNINTNYAHDFFGTRAADRVDGRYDSWSRRQMDTKASLIPGEEVVSPGVSRTNVSVIPWVEENARRHVQCVISAAVQYKSALDDRWHRTERSYVFGKSGEAVFEQRNFYEDNLNVSGVDLARSRFRAGEAT